MSGIYQWAPPTWIFFHYFANKINEKFFISNRKECLDIIKLICNNLPCTECTKHAKRFMLTVNETNIKTKQDLINMLFCFHNIVNKRLGKPLAKKLILNNYNNIPFYSIVNKFLLGYSKRYGSLMGGIISSLPARRRITQHIKKWLKQNWIQFQ
jgi:hypothetical protein